MLTDDCYDCLVCNSICHLATLILLLSIQYIMASSHDNIIITPIYPSTDL